jgi:hypothetical protein
MCKGVGGSAVNASASRLGAGQLSDGQVEAIREAITEAQLLAWSLGARRAIFAAEVKAKHQGVTLDLADVAKSLGVEPEG